MTRLLPRVTVLLLAACLAGGCQTDIRPSPGLADPIPAPENDPEITLLAPELRPWLGFWPAIVVDDGERPLEIERPMRNLTDRLYLLDYRFVFYDELGREVEPVMGWRFQELRPKQTVRLKAKALDRTARTHRLEIKWAR